MAVRLWNALSSRERDARIAERVMGIPSDRLFVEDTAQGSNWRSWSPTFPSYTTDPTAARLVEDAIERRGLQEAYVCELIAAVGAYPEQAARSLWYVVSSDLWALIRATPAQRCEAAWRAVDGTSV